MRADVLSKKGFEEFRADVITKSEFQAWRKRIETLGAGELPNAQVSWMQQQVNRLDPANKSLAFKEFSEFDGPRRTAAIEKFFYNIDLKNVIVNIDHIYSGPPGQRVMSPVSVVELPSRALRETSLKKLEGHSILTSANVGSVSVARAKTSVQLKRNGALQQACEKLKKDSRCKDKSVEIVWQMEGKKDRGVKVGDQIAFLQISTDLTGKYNVPFNDLTA